jgi:hypothetical protein
MNRVPREKSKYDEIDDDGCSMVECNLSMCLRKHCSLALLAQSKKKRVRRVTEQISKKPLPECNVKIHRGYNLVCDVTGYSDTYFQQNIPGPGGSVYFWDLLRMMDSQFFTRYNNNFIAPSHPTWR